MDASKGEIVFPRDWEYRVFCAAASIEDVKQEVVRIVCEMDMPGLLLENGDVSSSGTYRALRVTVEVADKEQANELGKRLKAISGVKFIL